MATQEAVKDRLSGQDDDLEKEIAKVIKMIHDDEFAELAGRDDLINAVPFKGYPGLCFYVVLSYVKFVVQTWAWTIWNIATLPMALLDIISQLYWATVSSALLFVLAGSCLFMRMPIIAKAFASWSDKNAGGLSIINAADPDMFDTLSQEQYKASRDTLSQPIKACTDNNYQRTFNLDIAKMLLLCASLMYERPEYAKLKFLREIRSHVGKASRIHGDKATQEPDTLEIGETFTQMFASENAAAAVRAQLDAETDIKDIQSYAANMGLRFHILSELNSLGNASVGIFYSLEDNFIILAFKGTGASEFGEWLTDCSFVAVEGGTWLRGFGNVQKGFMDRMFPAGLRHNARMPWDSIRLGIQKVSALMASKRPEGTKINVYFTGHSLGCAMASLAYSRANLEPEELGEHAQIRDGYIFAAPLMCDVRSVNSFNNSLYHKPALPRTLWRITQGRDIVATGLPAWGDTPNRRLSPFNMFGYAHLGTELTMKNPPRESILTGHSLIPGSRVVLFGEVESPKIQSTNPNALRKILGFLHHIPVVSRVVDHCPYLYFDQLLALENGRARWDQPVF